MKFNRKEFFTTYNAEFGSLNQSQVDAIEFLLDCFENDDSITNVRHFAYMLATVKHETANTFLPIQEYGSGHGKKYGVVIPATGHAYFGRGFVQLTWNYNYIAVGKAIGLGNDLYLKPELAMQPLTAYKIMSYGMTHGTFTGKKLSFYINDRICDYYSARKIINGLDKARLIKGYAHQFENCLTGSL